MTYENPELLMSKLISASRKHNAFHVLRKPANTEIQILTDWYLCSTFKDQSAKDLLISVFIMHFHINQLLCLRDITHFQLYDNMH